MTTGRINQGASFLDVATNRRRRRRNRPTRRGVRAPIGPPPRVPSRFARSPLLLFSFSRRFERSRFESPASHIVPPVDERSSSSSFSPQTHHQTLQNAHRVLYSLSSHFYYFSLFLRSPHHFQPIRSDTTRTIGATTASILTSLYQYYFKFSLGNERVDAR